MRSRTFSNLYPDSAVPSYCSICANLASEIYVPQREEVKSLTLIGAMHKPSVLSNNLSIYHPEAMHDVCIAALCRSPYHPPSAASLYNVLQSLIRSLWFATENHIRRT